MVAMVVHIHACNLHGQRCHALKKTYKEKVMWHKPMTDYGKISKGNISLKREKNEHIIKRIKTLPWD